VGISESISKGHYIVWPILGVIWRIFSDELFNWFSGFVHAELAAMLVDIPRIGALYFIVSFFVIGFRVPFLGRFPGLLDLISKIEL